MELTPIYSQLSTEAPKHDAPVSKPSYSVIVETYPASAYQVNNRVRENGGEYSNSKKDDSDNGTCHASPEKDKGGTGESFDSSTKEQLLGDIENSPSNSDKQQEVNSSDPTTYSKKYSKKRRWGEGNGYIEWRTITKNGREYNQAYYHWKVNGNKYSRYIPKKLLGLITEADKQKRPVREILDLLGVISSSSDQNYGVDIHNGASTHTTTSKNDSDFICTLPGHSQTRRHKGDGSGCIQWKTIIINGKKYSQPWYHYEFWNSRERAIKSSRYIPKRLLNQVIQLDADKVPVKRILELLGVFI